MPPEILNLILTSEQIIWPDTDLQIELLVKSQTLPIVTYCIHRV
jgi:hypothetical protein